MFLFHLWNVLCAVVTFIQVFGRKSDSATTTLQPTVAGLDHLSWSRSAISHLFVSLTSFALLLFVLLGQLINSDCLSTFVLNTTHSHTAVFPLITVTDYLGHRRAESINRPLLLWISSLLRVVPVRTTFRSTFFRKCLRSHAFNPVHRKLRSLALTPGPWFVDG